jgi:hypothetical protein
MRTWDATCVKVPAETNMQFTATAHVTSPCNCRQQKRRRLNLTHHHAGLHINGRPRQPRLFPARVRAAAPVTVACSNCCYTAFLHSGGAALGLGLASIVVMTSWFVVCRCAGARLPVHLPPRRKRRQGPPIQIKCPGRTALTRGSAARGSTKRPPTVQPVEPCARTAARS